MYRAENVGLIVSKVVLYDRKTYTQVLKLNDQQEQFIP